MKRLLPLLLLASSCGPSGDVNHPKLKPFPSTFLWGTATAPYQIEGGLHAGDWHQWESTPANPTMSHADDGDHSYQLFDTDNQIARDAGHNAMRLGIDFSRLFPTAAQFPMSPDPAAVKHYHDLFASMKAHGLRPMVTLYHWVLPIWLQDLANLSDTSGWLDDDIPNKFAQFAGWAAKEYAAEVEIWCTLNEPVVNLAAGYFNGIHPPLRNFSAPGGVDKALKAARNMVLAHARAYDAIHAAQPAAQVGVAFNMANFQSATADDPMIRAQHEAATKRLHYISNVAFQQAVTRGDLDYDLDEKLDGANDKTADPALMSRLDWMGLNYYSIVQVSALGKSSIGPVTGLPKTSRLDTDHPKSEYGWDIYPPGMRASLDELRAYGLPIYITENGIADSTDAQRPRFLTEHLYVLQKAVEDGIDVRGYFQWSLIDNFEWHAGYCPRFGLFSVDMNDPLRKRTARGSVGVYKKIIDEMGVDPELFKKYPDYPVPASTCKGG